MKNGFFSKTAILVIIATLVSCGEGAGILPGGDRYHIDFSTLEDGDILLQSESGKSDVSIFFRLRGNDDRSSGLALFTDLYNERGETVAHHEKKAPALNADTPINLSSQLPPGYYSLELKLMKGDLLFVKEKKSFFLVKQALAIQGILSYPLLIYPSRTALLIADINETAGLNPYLKWTQGKKVIARGLLSEGYNQIIWESPKEDGIYSIRVEAYPFPPYRTLEFAFASPVKANAELFISDKNKMKAAEKKRASQYTLFDIYIKALREREMNESPRFKQPRPAIMGEEIGLRFNGQAGIACPELILPARSDAWKSYTLTLGIRFEGETAGRRILSLESGDSGFFIDYAFSEEGELGLLLKTPKADYTFPSGIKKLEPGMRYLIQLSISASPGRWRVAWENDGVLTRETEKALALTPGENAGLTVIGGEGGARCVIDTLDVSFQ